MQCKKKQKTQYHKINNNWKQIPTSYLAWISASLRLLAAHDVSKSNETPEDIVEFKRLCHITKTNKFNYILIEHWKFGNWFRILNFNNNARCFL